MKEKDKKELIELLDEMERGQLEGHGSKFERLIKEYPEDGQVLNIYGEYLYITKNYKKFVELISPHVDSERDKTHSIFQLAIAYLRTEDYENAKKYLDRCLVLNHRYAGIFEALSELQVIDALFKSYKRLKDDPWFIFAAAKTFRKYNWPVHYKKFLADLEKRFPDIFNLTFIQADLKLIEKFDNKDTQNLNEFLKSWSAKNIHIPCLFHHYNFFAPRNNFSKSIAQ